MLHSGARPPPSGCSGWNGAAAAPAPLTQWVQMWRKRYSSACMRRMSRSCRSRAVAPSSSTPDGRTVIGGSAVSCASAGPQARALTESGSRSRRLRRAASNRLNPAATAATASPMRACPPSGSPAAVRIAAVDRGDAFADVPMQRVESAAYVGAADIAAIVAAAGQSAVPISDGDDPAAMNLAHADPVLAHDRCPPHDADGARRRRMIDDQPLAALALDMHRIRRLAGRRRGGAGDREGEAGGKDRRETVHGPACGGETSATLKHDPEKWLPVFGKDHAQIKGRAG